MLILPLDFRYFFFVKKQNYPFKNFNQKEFPDACIGCKRVK